MDDAANEPVPLRSPPPVGMWLWRVWIVLMIGLTAWIMIDVLRGGTLRAEAMTLPYDVLAAGLLVFALASGAVGWWLAALPRPDDRVLAALSRSAGRQGRRAAVRAIRWGHDVDPAHRGYAAAWVTQQRRPLMMTWPVAALIWGQVLLAAGQEDSTGWFRFVLAVAVVFTVTAAGSTVLQLRRERAVRPYLSDPRRS